MRFQKLVASMMMLLLAACGQEGQHWHGTLEEDGKTIEYETYYSPPGLGEKVFGGSNGLAYRLVIDGNTVDFAGNYIPVEWNENKGDPMAYSADFWGNVAEKFKAINPGKEHEEEHTWIYNVLVDWRDTMRRPGHGQTLGQALTTQPTYDVPVHTDTNEKLTTDEEDAYSRKMGEKMASYLLENTPGEYWGSTRRVLNRGFKGQIREPGYEFKQTVELWAESALFGWDHSGTIVETYRRPKGTGDNAWQSIGRFRACNHGKCPMDGDMRRRQICDEGIVSDWYVLDGECEGNWMSSHLCNDDTSLQLNHSRGVWTGNKCPGSKRGIVPKCGRQFR